MVWEVGCPYVSHARATMLRKSLDWGAEAVVFIDHDLSFEPEGLLKLIETEGPVVSGLYRFKKDEEEYMGILREQTDGTPFVREDGCIRADKVPAGFLKITREAVDTFMKAYPELIYGVRYNPSIDLFNHGAHDGVWYGEDYSFSRRWRECGGEIWIVPDINLTHHSADKEYPGNFHKFMLRQPGGSEEGR
jgi:glycosyltransferase involved in cell wall biosynthesis